jgi:ATP-dependent phosphoenolpyruvate carboxykinase
MHNLSIIWRSTQKNLAKELAEQIYEMSIYGQVVVVAEKPPALLAATKKQWARAVRLLQRERSSTLDASKISKTTQQIAWMQNLSFSARQPRDASEANVVFGTADCFVIVPPLCRTLFVTYKLDEAALYMLTSWMPQGARVIFYDQH